jgi:hypothetical protein
MIIVSKFDVHNLVKRKFDSGGKLGFTAFEVMEVISQTCYAGTQIFYLCKPIIVHREFKNEYSKEGEFSFNVGHGLASRDGELGWTKYREDELIELPKEEMDVILGVSKP